MLPCCRAQPPCWSDGQSYGLYFELNAAQFRQTCSRGLPKPVSEAIRQPGLVAPIPHPSAEAGGGEWLSLGRHQIGHITCRGCVNDALQLRDDRKLQADELALTLLELHNGQPIVVDVLIAELHQIRTTLPCAKCPRQS